MIFACSDVRMVLCLRSVFDLYWALTCAEEAAGTSGAELPGPGLGAFVLLQTYAPKLRAQLSKRLWNVDISWPSAEVFAAQTGLSALSSSPGTVEPASPLSAASPSQSDVAAADAESERRARVKWARSALASAIAACPTGQAGAVFATAFEHLVLAPQPAARSGSSSSSSVGSLASLADALGLPLATPQAASKLVSSTLSGEASSSQHVLPLAMGGHGYVTSSSPRKRLPQSHPGAPASPSAPGLREAHSHPVPGLPVHPPPSPIAASSSPASSPSVSSSAAVPSPSSATGAAPLTFAASAPATLADPPTTPVGKQSSFAASPPLHGSRLLLAHASTVTAGTEAASSAPLGVIHVRKGTVIHADVHSDGASSSSSSSSSSAAVASGSGSDDDDDDARCSGLRDLVVEGCVDAFVYVLRPFRHASVRACSSTTVVVGAVAGVLTIDLCEGCHVIAATRQLRIGSSVGTTASVFCLRPPLVFGDCREVRVGPHCAPYRGMRRHLRTARLLPRAAAEAASSGQWAAFRVLGPAPPAAAGGGAAAAGAGSASPAGASPTSSPSSSSSSHAGGSGEAASTGPEQPGSTAAAAKALPPSSYSPIVVPAPAGVAGAEDLVLPLPPAWVEAACQTRSQVRAVRAAIRDAALPAEQSALLKRCVEGAFKQWLVASGNVRQVADLARMHSHPQGEGAAALQSPGGTQRVVFGVMSPSVSQASSASALPAVTDSD